MSRGLLIFRSSSILRFAIVLFCFAFLDMHLIVYIFIAVLCVSQSFAEPSKILIFRSTIFHMFLLRNFKVRSLIMESNWKKLVLLIDFTFLLVLNFI